MKAWRDVASLPRSIWVLFTATLVNRMGTMVLPFLVLYCRRELGFSPEAAGFALTMYGIASIASAGLGGRLIDRLGALRIMQVSLAASGTALLFFPLLRGRLAVFLMVALWSLVAEVYRPASLVAITDMVTSRERKAAIAVIRLAINAGMTVGPAIGGLLAAVAFRWMFFLDGGTTLAAAVILVLSARRLARGERQDRLPLGHASDRAPSHSTQGSQEPALIDSAQTAAVSPAGLAPAELPAQHVGSALRDPLLLRFLAGVVLMNLVFFQIDGALPLFLVENLHLSPAFYGAMFTLNTVLIIAVEIPLVSATSHVPYRRVLPTAALLFAAGFGALAFVSGPWSVAGTVVLWTVGEMLLFAPCSAYVGEIAPPSRRGEYMGLYTMCIGAGLALGPWAGTWLLSRRGPALIWGATSLVSVAAAALLATLPERRAMPAPA